MNLHLKIPLTPSETEVIEHVVGAANNMVSSRLMAICIAFARKHGHPKISIQSI